MEMPFSTMSKHWIMQLSIILFLMKLLAIILWLVCSSDEVRVGQLEQRFLKQLAYSGRWGLSVFQKPSRRNTACYYMVLQETTVLAIPVFKPTLSLMPPQFNTGLETQRTVEILHASLPT